MDLQQAFNISVALVAVFGGWWMKTIYDTLKALRDGHEQIKEKVQAIEVLVAGEYVKQEKHQQDLDALSSGLFKKLDRIEDKLDAHLLSSHPRVVPVSFHEKEQ